MNGIFKKIFFITLIFSLESCVQKERVAKRTSLGRDASVAVTSVAFKNNQLIIKGAGFTKVDSIQIKNASKVFDFTIDSISTNQIIANTLSAINFTSNSIFDLILENAQGASTFPIAFTISNNSITAAMLTSMGASVGQVLKFNGTTWAPGTVTGGSAQSYLGTWDASSNIPDLSNPSSIAGDYYIVSMAGTFNGETYTAGDLVISDGSSWGKISNSPNDSQEIPASINSFGYYGRLVHSNGSPVSGPVTIRIDLAYTFNLGNILCTQNIPNVSLNKGYFQVKLDLNCASGATLENVLSQIPMGESAAIQITDVTNSKTYAFQEMYKVPFANYANVSSNLIQMGASDGEFLKWNDVEKKWLPGVVTGVGSVTFVSGTLPISVANGSFAPVISISQATTSTHGYLSSTDWNTFNNKQNTVLTTYSINGGAKPTVSNTDTVAGAFGKVQKYLNDINSDYISKTSNQTINGSLAINSATGFITVPTPINPNDATNKSYVDSFGQWSKTAGNIYFNSGNVGIGTTFPGYLLDVQGGSVNSSGGYSQISDVRFKKDIFRIQDALEKILKIDGVFYNFRNEEFPDRKFSTLREMGVIAQKVERIFPEAVTIDKKGFRSVAYSMLIAPIIESIRELNQKIVSLFKSNSEQSLKISRLESENKMLKDYLCRKDPSATFCSTH